MSHEKSKYNCAFCLTPISKGHFENQFGKCQRCHYYFPDAMPFQNICLEFGCTEIAKMGEEYCVEHLADVRYNTPKLPPQAKEDTVTKAINENPIYREVNSLLKDEESKKAQRKQIAYGLDKYPETLNPDSWSTSEALEHLQSELVDALHYIGLLLEKERSKP